MENALPEQLVGIIFQKGVPIPEMPEGWDVREAKTLFENILARYVWRYLHVQTHTCITQDIWKDTFPVIINRCWYIIIALFEAVVDKWVEGQDISSPDPNDINPKRMYDMAIAKSRYRRKSRYEDI